MVAARAPCERSRWCELFCCGTDMPRGNAYSACAAPASLRDNAVRACRSGTSRRLRRTARHGLFTICVCRMRCVIPGMRLWRVCVSLMPRYVRLRHVDIYAPCRAARLSSSAIYAPYLFMPIARHVMHAMAAHADAVHACMPGGVSRSCVRCRAPLRRELCALRLLPPRIRYAFILLHTVFMPFAAAVISLLSCMPRTPARFCYADGTPSAASR